MTRRVVITGMGGITAFGEDWPTISRRLRSMKCGAYHDGVAGV